jgi:nitrite reductase (NO-forming)
MAYDPVLPRLTTERVHRVTLTVEEREAEVAPGVWQRRWTYNGTSPGPTLHGRVGDVFEVTLVNHGSMGHSVDFHAGSRAPDEVMRTVPPGAGLTYRFTASRAGIWLYHCSTMPMSAHLAAGLVGAVVIEPPDLPVVSRSFLLVQSELYLGASTAHGSASEVDATKPQAATPDGVVFNGTAFQYDSAPLQARVGERVRFWVLDAGPNRATSFHVVGAQFDAVWAEGAWLLRRDAPSSGSGSGSQTLSLGAAQGGFVETTFAEAGHYPFVSHVMADAERGAHGVVQVQPR